MDAKSCVTNPLKTDVTRRGLLKASAAIGAVAFLGSGVSFAQEGKILRVRARVDIQNLDPAFRLTSGDTDAIGCLFASLATFKTGDEWGWRPYAAKTLTVIDDTHVGFELHPGLMFSDGFGEMTAEDVKFSYERFIDPGLKSPFSKDWAQLDRVDVKDKYSGVIVLKAPFAPLWTSTLPTVSSSILSKKALEKAGGKYTTQPPATCGPYTIKKWEPKTELVLARNPDWKLTPVGFDEIHIMPIDDDKTAELGLESGSLDFTLTSISSIPRYLKAVPDGITFARKPSLSYAWIGLNQENPALADERVRRAIQYAVDRAAVVDAAYLGAAETATGIIAPGLVGHREKNLFDHDPEKAKALLDEAGVKNLSLTISVLNKAERVAAAQMVQANLAEIGVTAEVQPYDSATFWTLGSEKDGTQWKDLQLIINDFVMQPDPSWATAWFTPDQIGTWNWERFRNEEYGKLNQQGLAELDNVKRNEIYIKMQDLMEQSGSYIFLTHEATGVLCAKTVKPSLRPDGLPLYAGFSPA